jgi:hypothetical protein
MTALGQFPFGARVLPCGDQLPEPCDAFVLGAYPSAIHVRWVPPKATGLRPISALPVDNEPSVFWNGADADERVGAWKERYFDPAWGDVSAARLNGPAGSWLRSKVLDPLASAGVANHIVTDCLTTYRLSSGAAARLLDTYDPMADQTPSLESARLQEHPSEERIVREALQSNGDRLKEQIVAAQPRVIVTLGNAASRVLSALAGQGRKGALRPEGYGRATSVTVSSIGAAWVALVHPATPKIWQERHQAWLDGPGFNL